MKKILFISPHLSTGGLPQYLFKTIQLLNNDFEIFLIEYSFLSPDFVVQRNKIVNLLRKDHFFSLRNDKKELLSLINNINPEIIHLEEIPEYFMDLEIAEKIYFNQNRNYLICETTHSSDFDVSDKIFFPDKFFFVCPFSNIQYINFNTPSTIIEYPISILDEPIKKEKIVDQNYFNILIPGLFTPRKNQSYIFEIAQSIINKNILFHFVGNQAPNFAFYWEPLMKNKPANCIVWGERKDIDNFYQTCDLCIFASLGKTGDMELNPLVIKEALRNNIPLMIFNLDVYLNRYKNFESITFLTGNIKKDCEIIENQLKLKKEPEGKTVMSKSPKPIKEIFIIDTYTNTESKEQILNKLIDQLNKTNKDILIVSHYPIPESINKKVKYFLYDSDNLSDINHNLSTHGPDYWVDNDKFRMDSIISTHPLPISKSMNLSLNLAKSLGYEYFTFMEFDCNISDKDFPLIEKINHEVVNENKKLYFFKTKPHEFTWHNMVVYETMMFGGFIDEFLSVFIPPRTQEEWSKITNKYKEGYCFESIFMEYFSPFEEKYKIYDKMSVFFKNSIINEFTINEAMGIFYNTKDKSKPVVFICNHDHKQRRSKYLISINISRYECELDCDWWWYETIDTSKGNIDVKIECIRDQQIYRRFWKTIGQHNIEELKPFHQFYFK